MKTKLLVFIVPLIFLVVSILGLKDYGISWDEPIHFYRGQAYLYYFLTGKTNFESLPKIIEQQRAREGQDYASQGFISVKDYRKSYYQDNSLSAQYFLINDDGHPPLNDILAASTNYIFYQKLGVVSDLYSHHLFNIFASVFLVLVVVAFSYQVFGIVPAIFSGLILVTYPLFFAESQFNIKDPPQAAFFAASIWAFWNSTRKGNWKWLFASAVFAGVSFGMKFNALFLPFIFVPYLAIKYFGIIRIPSKILPKLKKIPKKYFIALVCFPLVFGLIFFVSWPFLWQDPIGNFTKIFGYYKQIGSGGEAQHAYLGLGPLNIYPLYWILITTPPITLVSFFIGLFFILKNKNEKNTATTLWVIWFLMPLTRVTMPGASIYGGIRQIFEYIPAMSLICGAAIAFLVKKFKINPKTGILFAVFLIIPNIFILKSYHPNENVYFNEIVGGLSGAQKKGIPYWGNSFGNAYWQAIQWLNANAPQGAKLALIQGTGLNIPQEMLRSDIQYGNAFWSGMERKGEYLLELTHDDPVKVYPYAWEYVGVLLKPVYEVKVDGVAIAKLWKNDLASTYEKYRSDEKIYQKVSATKEGQTFMINMSEQITLTHLKINFDSRNTKCGKTSGVIFTSTDGNLWKRELDAVPTPQITSDIALSSNEMNFFFAARQANKVKFEVENKDACVFSKPKISIYYIPNL